MAITFESFTVTKQNWLGVSLYFKVSDIIEELYYYINGSGYKSSSISSTNEGTFNIAFAEELLQKDVTIQLEAIKDNKSIWSKEIITSTLTGCSGIEVTNIDLDNGHISTTLTNPNLADIKLSLGIVCPMVFQGRDHIQNEILTKSLTKASGSYIWNLTDDELSTILYRMRYCTSARIFLSATSYIPNNGTQLSKHITYYALTLTPSDYVPIIESFVTTRDTDTTEIIDLDTYLIQGISSLTVTMPVSNITMQGGAELQYVTWACSYYRQSTSLEKINYKSQTSFSKSWTSSSFYNATMLQVEFKVTDSRGLTSSVSKIYNILPYHKPVIYADIVRPLNSGGTISINYKASYSRLNINGTDYNNLSRLNYGHRKITEGLPTADTALPGVKYENSSNTMDKELSLVSDLWMTLDPELNYRFIFTIQDKLNTYGVYVDLIDGKPIMRMMNNGQIGIGREVNVEDSDTLLFVASDICGVDIEGNDRKVFDTMSNLIILSSTQPEDQIVGGIWLEVDDS